jgi:hypothetical protein
MVNAGRNYALFSILTLQAFGALEAAVELYGTRTHLYRCLLLGDTVYFNYLGQLCITDRETWGASWLPALNRWRHNDE